MAAVHLSHPDRWRAVSVEAVSWVLRGQDGRCASVRGDGHYVGRHAVLLVLLVIAEHADLNGRGACPSQRTIALQTGLDRRQVQHALVQLEADRWIVETDPAVPRQRGTTYRIPGLLGGGSTAQSISTDHELGGGSTAETDGNSAVHSAVHSAVVAPHEPEPDPSVENYVDSYASDEASEEDLSPHRPHTADELLRARALRLAAQASAKAALK